MDRVFIFISFRRGEKICIKQRKRLRKPNNSREREKYVLAGGKSPGVCLDKLSAHQYLAFVHFACHFHKPWITQRC